MYEKNIIKNMLCFRSIPTHLKARHRAISSSDEAKLGESLAQHFFLEPPNYLNTPEGHHDLDVHIRGKTEEVRKTVVPWLDSLFRLDGSKIIEVGCGTGDSSIALAEQGAQVIGYDVDLPSLTVAKNRFSLYNLPVELKHASAVDISTVDVANANAVIFFASLEHMTTDERLSSLSLIWPALRSGAYLIVVETPNRLWWYDGHTSHLPFYNWLPNDVAVLYSKYSPRKPFNEQLKPPVNGDNLMHLARLGRGVSYHEFELALGIISKLQIHSLNRYKRHNACRFIKWLIMDSLFESWLRFNGPQINSAFYEQEIALAICKP